LVYTEREGRLCLAAWRVETRSFAVLVHA
jgi:hypothetical protein